MKINTPGFVKRNLSQLKKAVIYCYLVFLTILIFSVNAQSQNCADTSFRLRYYSPGSENFGILFHTNISNNETLLLGDDNDRVQNIYRGALMKINSKGDVLWSKQITEPGRITYWIKAIELTNRNIAIIGYNISVNSAVAPLIHVILTDKDGNLLWNRSYNNSNYIQNLAVFPNVLTEGQNGDLIFGWNGVSLSQSAYAIIARVNSAGDIIWSKGYNATNGAIVNFSNSFFNPDNTLIITANVIDDLSCSETKLLAMKLNYTDGNLQVLRPFCYNENQSGFVFLVTPPIDFFNSSVKKYNGEVELFGRFYSHNANVYFYRLGLDASLNYKNSKTYTFPNPQQANIPNAKIQVLENGSIQIMGNTNKSNKKNYWGSIDPNGNIVRQRKINYSTDSAFYNSRFNFGLKNNGSMTYTTNYVSNNTAFAEFNQLQNDDPSVDSCLGVDTAFISTLPFTVTPSNWQWKNIINNPVLSSPSVITVTDFLVQKELVCGNISYCDSIKIYGPDTICVLGQETDFTARTNNGCNKRIQWRLDTASCFSCNQINDSTLRVRFQNFGGAGSHSLWLYAYASNCGTIKDSLKVTLFPVPTPLSSSGTLKLCPGDTLKLSPGNWFKSYLWQDGSTDSVYKATSSGLYKVRIEAVCGYVMYESVLVTSPELSLGNDKIKCNADTIILKATGGFSNYTWQSDSNIKMISDSMIKVFPSFSQQYTVSAVAYSGCLIKDTVFIEVRQSPAIKLGNDTSLCKNSSLILHTGKIFNNYTWSTGETSDSIIVSEQGAYMISALYNNGCISKDTINILNIYDLPTVNINSGTVLCKNQNDYLDAGPGFLSYLWQDGTTNRKYKVSTPGPYNVMVIDNNNCRNSDTVIITKITLPPSGFLKDDTSFCKGNSITLKPDGTFINYLWSNGSSTISTIVRQEGVYALTVKDGFGCMGTDTIIVHEQNCLNNCFVPTGFTPNNDGKNDIFKPIITGTLASYEFSIYNRWGQRVFLSTDRNQGWDGTLKGLSQDGNTFVWICKYQFYNQPPEIKKGVVTLIR